ncbi:MAG TPA: hypothetical protein VHL31_01305 [Geminicoccus sp.]|uniref:hypothetical protein n=1 Tax=Geminicoccus sp. TaxID=2024832 RepID=UPI002E30CC68|nr:hypothetical protein [Geminicoccus sp.]HEX2524924.1 hypothetical protein [Geminicoccus sp.]
MYATVPSRPAALTSGIGLNLQLLLPERDRRPDGRGVLLEFGAPAFFGVRLSSTVRVVEAPEYLLDPKAGYLRVRFRRRLHRRRGDEPFEVFRPIVTRCFRPVREAMVRIGRDEPLEDNLQMFYGQPGFPLAEPGDYELEVELRVEAEGGRPHVLRSNRIALRVGRPQFRADELEVFDLFDPLTGLYLALGGTKKALPVTHDRLKELEEARRHRNKDRADAVAAAILRARAIDAGRDYRAETNRSVQLFDQLAADLEVFNPITRRETEKLRDKRKAEVSTS